MEDYMVAHNKAKIWQIAFFALNNTATNLYLFAFMFVSYYAVGIAGLLVTVVSTLLTLMRAWDGVTDPIVGFIIDKTESKFGKFRPYIVLGNVILAVFALLIFKTTHLLPQSIRLVYFLVLYLIYIIGYSFQTTVTRAAQTALTNDPQQRPLFSLFDALYNTALFTGGQFYIASVLVPKHQGFSMGFFDEVLMITIVVAAIFSVLAIISLHDKDVKANWGLPAEKPVKFKDFWPVLKNNRPLQMLVISASTDKLAALTQRNAITLVIIYGVLMGNYALSGQIGLIVTPVTVIITFLGIGYARKMGLKKAYVLATISATILSFLLLALFFFADLSTVSLTNLNFLTVAFIGIFTLISGVSAVGGNIVIPMIADTSDYETYRTGQYIPGMIGTVFSFVDKLVSALSASFIGFTLALVGFTTALPTVDTPSSPALFGVGLFLFLGMPILGWVASLIAMKFYELDDQRMIEIQQSLHDRKVAMTK